jgi:hypothetical protein
MSLLIAIGALSYGLFQTRVTLERTEDALRQVVGSEQAMVLTNASGRSVAEIVPAQGEESSWLEISLPLPPARSTSCGSSKRGAHYPQEPSPAEV